MTALLLLSTFHAFAGDVLIGDDHLSSLGLGPATVIEGRVPVFRCPLLGGGVVTVARFADVAQAEQAFATWHRTGATTWPPTVTPSFPVDQTAGDGAALILVRVGPTVVMVRDASGRAAAVAGDVLAVLPPS